MKAFMVIMAATALGAIGGLFLQANQNVPSSQTTPTVAVTKTAPEPTPSPTVVVSASSSESTGKWKSTNATSFSQVKPASTTNNPYGPNSKPRAASGGC